MSDTKVTIEGLFVVASCAKNEYGVKATIVEYGETYPQSFSLTLPDGHMWERGEMARFVIVCAPRTINAKAGGNKFMIFEVTEYKKIRVTVQFKEEKSGGA